jgi:hypothetical protein
MREHLANFSDFPHLPKKQCDYAVAFIYRCWIKLRKENGKSEV